MKILNCITMAVILTTASAVFGGQDRGGGNPEINNEAAIRLLIKGGGLKNAMLNYVKTLQINKIEDTKVKRTFMRVMANQELVRDIKSNGNYLDQPSCKDEYNKDVPASTVVGAGIGAPICFDVEKIAAQYKDLTSNEMMIRLASLAFHEHIHHFQDPAQGAAKNETEAYRVSAYIQVTARIVQIPLLEWQQKINIADVQGTSLYEKLKLLFESSDVPYPVEQHLITSKNAKPLFEHCVSSAYPSDSADEMDSPTFLKIRFNNHSDHGPVDPQIPIYKIIDGVRGLLNVKNAVFRNNAIEGTFLDIPDDYLAKPQCRATNGSNLGISSMYEYFDDLKSGISPDHKSFFVQNEECHDGRRISQSQYKLAGDYLVVKFDFSNSYDSAYGYCWNSK